MVLPYQNFTSNFAAKHEKHNSSRHGKCKQKILDNHTFR